MRRALGIIPTHAAYFSDAATAWVLFERSPSAANQGCLLIVVLVVLAEEEPS